MIPHPHHEQVEFVSLKPHKHRNHSLLFRFVKTPSTSIHLPSAEAIVDGPTGSEVDEFLVMAPRS